MNIIPFQYENQTLRSVEVGGKVWYVAKDVAQLLDYSNTNDAVKTHCKNALEAASLLGGRAELHTQECATNIYPTSKMIGTSDVLRLIGGCTKPEVEPIKDWMFDDVLTQVVETGKYVDESRLPTITEKDVTAALAMFPKALKVAETSTISQEAQLAAFNAVRSATGVDLMKIMNIEYINHDYRSSDSFIHDFKPFRCNVLES
jgi:prophage antirepressor-like protein